MDDRMVKALNETLVRWRRMTNWTYGEESGGLSMAGVPYTPGVLPWRGTYPWYNLSAETFEEWLARPPLDDPRLEPLFTYKDPINIDPPNRVTSYPGFAFDTGYGPDFARIYPPTGAGYMGARLIGISKTSRNATRAFGVLMDAFARNRRHHVNCPSVLNNNRGGISGYLGASTIPEYALTPKSFYDDLIGGLVFLTHTIPIGTPAAQSMSYGQIAVKNPMQIAFNDILYKDMSIADALARACVIINANTKPPCPDSDMEPYLEDDVVNNVATLKFKWKEGRDCNEYLPNSAQIPDPLIAAVPTPYISTDSNAAKSLMGITVSCMVVILIVIIMFLHKVNSPPIRAASWSFSLFILLGGELTLASVLMRVSADQAVGWPQCFGTYWLFSLGFGLVMGSLLIKTYRVDRIFRNTKVDFALPDSKLVGYLVLIELMEAALSLILQFKLENPSYWQMIKIPFTDYNVAQNSCPKANRFGPIALYTWNGIIILFAAIYALRTRKVQSAYNENIFTVAAIALISVMSIVIVPVLSAIESPKAVFILVALGTVVGTITSVLVFAVPKLMLAYGLVTFKESRASWTPSNFIRTHSEERVATPTGAKITDPSGPATAAVKSTPGPTQSQKSRRIEERLADSENPLRADEDA
ncbi:hypothetical protein HDV00_011851 [Rhizophlyctis rosea]|nr:hypothetical protein HDV00_011851 [Rhizophlyctis rosea]